METASILDESFLRDYNTEHEKIDEDELISPEPDEMDESGWDTEENPEEQPPDWVDKMESGDGARGGMDDDDIDDLSEAFVDGVRLGKDLISDYFKTRFGKLVNKTFPENRQRHLFLCTYADQQGKLSIDGVAEILSSIQKRSKKYENVEFDELMEVLVQYETIKKRYQAKELKEYQARGLQRNFGRVLRKYMDGANADPLAMLALYLGLAFAPDGINLYFAQEELKELKEETKKTA